MTYRVTLLILIPPSPLAAPAHQRAEKVLLRGVFLFCEMELQEPSQYENGESFVAFIVFYLSFAIQELFPSLKLGNQPLFMVRPSLLSLALQSCQMPLHPITPSSLLDSLCWSVSEPTSSACIFTESSEVEDANSVFYDAKTDGRDSEAPIESFSRLLRESERGELIFKNHFLTILFPIDRFGELGPSSRTFFSDSGFTCSQVLDHIYNFYQDNISADEAEVAIHTDSGHADKLRSLYAGKEALEQGFVRCRRIEFLGSRRYFEALKRISGQNNVNCYELLLRA